jgi:hypothetical protein
MGRAKSRSPSSSSTSASASLTTRPLAVTQDSMGQVVPSATDYVSSFSIDRSSGSTRRARSPSGSQERWSSVVMAAARCWPTTSARIHLRWYSSLNTLFLGGEVAEEQAKGVLNVERQVALGKAFSDNLGPYGSARPGETAVRAAVTGIYQGEAEHWTRWRAFAQVRRRSNIQLHPYLLIADKDEVLGSTAGGSAGPALTGTVAGTESPCCHCWVGSDSG